ncbi:glycosyltransferase [Caldivirga maquilingensis]|uniref:glycosyltransferase n=1 Tax=Caldivirga maquilingensis TaxID=76887 RepID=UPI0000F248F1|nr:glycosyltransferase [Caldivirga maquilingensis]
MSKPRLVVFTELYYPEGGAAELAAHLILGFLHRHFDVTIVTGTQRPSPEVFRFGRVIHVPWFRGLKPMVWLRSMINAGWFKKFIEDSHIIYISSHKLLPIAIIAKRVSKDARVIVHLHNYQPISYTSLYLRDREPSPATQAMIEYLENNSLTKALITGLISESNVISKVAVDYADTMICASNAQLKILNKYIKDITKRPW